ncbi:MAG: 4a-hydroxytetrahydrobiopterin dehydratase [Rhodobacteraceae bacterium]|nr:4a-hydroxytetrahydrobiopterin dehydratase [Paracoccaceae bacterium]
MQITTLMESYFKDTRQHKSSMSEGTSKFSKWEIIESPQRLVKDFQFATRLMAAEFLRQVILYENKTSHYGKLTFENTDVRIEVYTHDIDSITNIDYEYAEFVEQIFFDVCEYER